VLRGQAAAGVDPGLVVAVGTLVAETLGRAVAVAVAEGDVVGLAEREADAVGVGVGEVPTCAWGAHALTTTMPRARASAP
jgi:co-chaperonin GroES (HSP10)